MATDLDRAARIVSQSSKLRRWMYILVPSAVAIAALDYKRDVDDAKPQVAKVDVLRRRIRRFEVKNIPIVYAVVALNKLGVDVCFERVQYDKSDEYVDRDGVRLFLADRLISIDLKNAEVRQILDQLVEQHPLYRWVAVPGTSLINLIPKKSQLEFNIGPMNVHGNPYRILGNTAAFPGSERLRGGFRGGHLPKVTLKLPRCSARDFLNAMVKQHPGLVWRFSQFNLRVPSSWSVSFNQAPKPYMDEVLVVFPDARKGKLTNTSIRYEMKARNVNGVRRLVLKRIEVTAQRE